MVQQHPSDRLAIRFGSLRPPPVTDAFELSAVKPTFAIALQLLLDFNQDCFHIIESFIGVRDWWSYQCLSGLQF
jgi:hypothetical protein